MTITMEMGQTMDTIRRTEELIFISHFPTHSCVWTVHEIDDMPNNPSYHTQKMLESGRAIQGADSKYYLVACNLLQRDQIADLGSVDTFPEFFDTTIIVLNNGN